ncbi:hypothetical protein KC960_04330 [Candidatus Saccharibacteria bacterium]|nr:hypothetical protein [Candidatus Saccharibacteria bacterium]
MIFGSISQAQDGVINSYCERVNAQSYSSCVKSLIKQGAYYFNPYTPNQTSGVSGSSSCLGIDLPTINSIGGFASAINQYIDDYVGSKTSPFQGLGQAFVDGGAASGINPMLAVAQLKQENSMLVAGPNDSWAWNTYATSEAASSSPQDTTQKVSSYNAFGVTAGKGQPTVYYYQSSADKIWSVYQWSSWENSLNGEYSWFDAVKNSLSYEFANGDLLRYVSKYSGVENNTVYFNNVTETINAIVELAGDSLACGSGSSGNGFGNLEVTGSAIPCEGTQHTLTRLGVGVDWSELEPTGTIGKNSAGQDINVYIRDACPGQTTIRTVVVGATIHAGGEEAGQIVAHELLYNKQLPPDVRIIAIPVINGAGLTDENTPGRVNKNGVNLNRNFDYKWDQADCTKNPADGPNCKGPSPASEPETQAIQSFLLSIGKASLVLSYHSNTNIVYFSGPNNSESGSLALRYSQITNQPSSPNSGPGFFEAWYNYKTSTPALLVEASSDKSFEYFDKHADAVVSLLNENLVKPVPSGAY